jgi:hypothetical protein
MQKNIYTLCRSGNHAIIFWIMNNFGGFEDSLSVNSVVYRSSNNYICFVNNINHPVRDTPSIQEVSEYKNILISYEDFYKEDINQSNEIIILRDFYNTLASRYQLFKPLLGIRDQNYIHSLETFITYWKHLAKLSLSSNQYIYYNLWLTDKYYRDQTMIKYFNMKNQNDNTNFVSNIAMGSSYIGSNKECNINNYLYRYNSTNLPEEWKKIVDFDIEIKELCLNLENINEK